MTDREIAHVILFTYKSKDGEPRSRVMGVYRDLSDARDEEWRLSQIVGDAKVCEEDRVELDMYHKNGGTNPEFTVYGITVTERVIPGPGEFRKTDHIIPGEPEIHDGDDVYFAVVLEYDYNNGNRHANIILSTHASAVSAATEASRVANIIGNSELLSEAPAAVKIMSEIHHANERVTMLAVNSGKRKLEASTGQTAVYSAVSHMLHEVHARERSTQEAGWAISRLLGKAFVDFPAPSKVYDDGGAISIEWVKEIDGHTRYVQISTTPVTYPNFKPSNATVLAGLGDMEPVFSKTHPLSDKNLAKTIAAAFLMFLFETLTPVD